MALPAYLTAVSPLLGAATTYTAATVDLTANVMFNQNNIVVPLLPQSAADTWGTTTSLKYSQTVGGTTTTGTQTQNTVYTLGGTTISERVTDTSATTTGSSTTTETTEFDHTFLVLHEFLLGRQAPSTASFSDLWKKGNTVTFQCNRTEYDEIDYVGSTAPAAPTIGSNGTGLTGTRGVAPYYFVDKTEGETSDVSFSNYGDYVLAPAQLDSATRHLLVTRPMQDR